MLSAEILAEAAWLLDRLRARGQKIATAESCTGGLIAAALTHVPGSSDVMERGFVTYSNEAKTALLGVPASMIAAHGAVSEAVAASMAAGALAASRADIAVSVTGIAGPGGGSADKPVGLVWFGCARHGAGPVTERHMFAGNRESVRAQAVAVGLKLVETVSAAPSTVQVPSR